MTPQLPLVGGHHAGPLFIIRKQRPLARPKGKEGIVPLCGRIVSGLHVEWNLRVVQWRENSIKGAWFWPDMPFEQMELPL